MPGRRAASVPILRCSATLAAEAICEAVWSGGGEPLVLHGPDHDPAAELADRLARFDGICMPGGADMDPRRYGQEPAAETEDPLEHQDTFAMAVISCAIELGVPTLAICRGMQILCVVQGGDLVQHLGPSDVAHRNAVHDVVVAEGSHIFQVPGSKRIPVSSYHHQSVGVVGADLRVVGTADGGRVEVLEYAAGTMLAVRYLPRGGQAHPDRRRDRPHAVDEHGLRAVQLGRRLSSCTTSPAPARKWPSATSSPSAWNTVTSSHCTSAFRAPSGPRSSGGWHPPFPPTHMSTPAAQTGS